MNIKPISIDEFLQRVGSQPNGNIWSVLVIVNSHEQELVEELEEMLTKIMLKYSINNRINYFLATGA